MKTLTPLAFVLLSVAFQTAARPAPAPSALGVWTYAFAEYGTIRYPEGFDHYDFVNPNAPKGGTLRLSNPDRRTSFDKYNPFTLPQNAPAGVELFVFETLADASPDEPTTMYGLIASRMLVAPDYSSISFRINPLAHFTNGDPVTAQDVKYSFDMGVSPAAMPLYASIFDDVRDAVVIDPRTVRFDLKVPSRDQIYNLGTQLYVFSRKWGLDAAGRPKPFNRIVNDLPIATGPYLIAKGTGQILDLVRDPNYWARNLGVRRGYYNFDHLLYHYYSDEAARFEGFKAGDYDLLEEYSAKRFVRQYVGRRFRDGEIIKKLLPVGMTFFYEGFMINTRRPQLSDRRVRSALNYAFDWAWSVKQGYDLNARYEGLFANSEYAATGEPGPGELALLAPYRKELPPSVFGVPEPNPVSDTPGKLRANLRHARDLLAQAGWTIHPDGLLRNAAGEAFQLEILEDNFEFSPIIGRWAVSLRKLGIISRERVVDFAVYDKRLDAFDFDLTLLNFGYVEMPSPSGLNSYFSSGAAHVHGSNNVSGIANPAIDHVIAAMGRATTLPQIVDASRALDRIFRAEHYAVPYQYRPNAMMAYWNRFGMPSTLPKFYSVEVGLWPQPLLTWPIATWWVRPLK
jgi:ABC-type oligopeptide transport system substrate-binding subunit